MFILIIPIGLIYLLSVLISKKNIWPFASKKEINIYFWIILLLLTFFVGIYFMSRIFELPYSLEVGNLKYYELIPSPNILLKTIIYYFSYQGLLSILSIPGIIYLLLKKEKNEYDIFLLFTLAFLNIFILESIYFFTFSLIFRCLLIGYGALALVKNFKSNMITKISKYLLLFIIVMNLIVLIFIFIPGSTSESTPWLSNQKLTTAFFLNSLSNQENSFLSNNMNDVTRISPYVTIKPAVPHELTYLIYDFVKPENMKISIIPLKESILGYKPFIILDSPKLISESQDLLFYPIQSYKWRVLGHKYNIEYILTDDTINDRVILGGRSYASAMVNSVKKSQNKIYTNKAESIWSTKTNEKK
jgi:hypothetical protein